MGQTELTLNLLRQATLNPHISVWEYFNGAFDYAATPLGPIRCKSVIHTTSKNCKSWDQRGREGFSVGSALHHYFFIREIDSKQKALLITYTAEYLHEYLTQPTVTSESRMTHAIHFLSVALKYVPTSLYDSQLAAIKAVRAIFANWITVCPLQQSLSPQYQTDPNQLYRCKNHLQSATMHPLPRFVVVNTG